MIAMLFGGFEILFLLFLAPIALAAFAFWIWMLIHAATNKCLTDTEKLMWVLIIVFVHFVGALIYYFVGKPKKPTATA
jgi:hypothetical protein